MSAGAGVRPSSEHGVRFWVALAAGGALMAWGVALFLDATPDTGRRLNFTAWLVGLDLVHDAVVAPVAVLAGAALTRLVHGAWRAPLQAALFAGAVVLIVAGPPLARTADVARNPTIQPLDYTTATLTVLAVVWACAGGWGIVRSKRG